MMFRTDASLTIGSGHAMRCLTLAQTLRARGADCAFISRNHPGNLNDYIRDKGFEVYELPIESARAKTSEQDPANCLGASWEQDAEKCLKAMRQHRAEILIVDHYALGLSWEKQLKPACRWLLVIDDLANRPHHCDALLDQNLGRSLEDYRPLLHSETQLMIGPQYALLRPDFFELREYSLARRQAPELKQILISLGGVDKDNITGRILESLRGCSLPKDCSLTIVMGAHAPWTSQVRHLAKEMPWATRIRVDVQDMASTMAESDLAIGATGTTAWERCCLALPSISFILADNQREGAVALRDAGAILLIEDDHQFDSSLVKHMLKIADLDQLKALSSAAAVVTDGRGTSRVAEVVCNAQV